MVGDKLEAGFGRQEIEEQSGRKHIEENRLRPPLPAVPVLNVGGALESQRFPEDLVLQGQVEVQDLQATLGLTQSQDIPGRVESNHQHPVVIGGDICGSQ